MAVRSRYRNYETLWRHFQASWFHSAAPFIGPCSAGWFRLFGYGLFYRVNPPARPMWLYFSEREGKTKVVRIGRLVLGLITPLEEA